MFLAATNKTGERLTIFFSRPEVRIADSVTAKSKSFRVLQNIRDR